LLINGKKSPVNSSGGLTLYMIRYSFNKTIQCVRLVNLWKNIILSLYYLIFWDSPSLRLVGIWHWLFKYM
jgi:hypothetical protein